MSQSFRHMIHVQLHTLEDLMGVRLEFLKEILGLFKHNWVIFLHSVVVEILVKIPTILPPRGTVGHRSKAPVDIHPARSVIRKRWSPIRKEEDNVQLTTHSLEELDDLRSSPPSCPIGRPRAAGTQEQEVLVPWLSGKQCRLSSFVSRAPTASGAKKRRVPYSLQISL